MNMFKTVVKAVLGVQFLGMGFYLRWLYEQRSRSDADTTPATETDRLQAFDYMADKYEAAFRGFEGLFADSRESVVRRARGHVLDMCSGNGQNFVVLGKVPTIKSLTCVECLDSMLSTIKNKLDDQELERKPLHYPIYVFKADAERLPFPDQSFDSVLGALTLSSVEHPDEVLFEMSRVCKPGGRILIFDYHKPHWKPLHIVYTWFTEASTESVKEFGLTQDRDLIGLMRRMHFPIRTWRGRHGGAVMEISAAPIPNEYMPVIRERLNYKRDKIERDSADETAARTKKLAEEREKSMGGINIYSGGIAQGAYADWASFKPMKLEDNPIIRQTVDVDALQPQTPTHAPAAAAAAEGQRAKPRQGLFSLLSTPAELLVFASAQKGTTTAMATDMDESPTEEEIRLNQPTLERPFVNPNINSGAETLTFGRRPRTGPLKDLQPSLVYVYVPLQLLEIPGVKKAEAPEPRRDRGSFEYFVETDNKLLNHLGWIWEQFSPLAWGFRRFTKADGIDPGE
ncbi:unnamed protein product [Vitrella brassicaformis CCMP3155]|uniref:Methyltransferase type 11 domain-containing protein n=1 Tax=Vitrella brassicaformis (strain CCMP3155) TaxID=1169540 RepID=A0A0G4EXJ4_VITBC|nr:unnamed protein product [Vitrella brassicaformis CCMP3155]|eukprot:CEM03431.1 unnamed protein product [Vitrella brassicaformis CCMP3155]